jgi:hypothetical protein
MNASSYEHVNSNMAGHRCIKARTTTLPTEVQLQMSTEDKANANNKVHKCRQLTEMNNYTNANST